MTAPSRVIALTTHIWYRNNIILELNNTGAIVNRFSRGLGGRLIASDHHGIYLHNVRGDVVQRVGIQQDNQLNNQGHNQPNQLMILHTYLYDAFGNELNENPDNTNPFRYAGEYWDWETQTYYLRARHFNPRTGRFTQPDPFWNISNMTSNVAAILQSGNLFVYTMHNPVMFIDPTGLWADEYEGTGNCLFFMLDHPGDRSPESIKRDFLAFQQRRNQFVPGAFAAAQAAVAMATLARHLEALGNPSEIILLGTHDVFGVGGHAGLIILIDEHSSLWGNPMFSPHPWASGIKFATIGAGPQNDPTWENIFGWNFGFLVAEENHYRDVGILTGASPGSRMIRLDADAGQILALLAADLHFRTYHNTSLNYTPVPLSLVGSGSFNSNSYIAGLLDVAGIPAPSLAGAGRRYPGWSLPVPPSFFGH